MREENQEKLNELRYFQAQNRLHNHRPWYIYTVAVELEQPFSLGELRDAIYKKAGIRPQIRRLLEETHQFYEKYDMALINRTELEIDAFTVNEDIDLDKACYKEAIHPPKEGPGRPRKKRVHSEK